MASRPAVLVYQEFAALSITPTTPELNVCVVGPCYQLMDYPEDLLSQTMPTYGTETTVADGDLSTPAAAPAQAVLTIPSVTLGAVVDTDSVVVTLPAATVEIMAGTATTATAELITPSANPQAAGVAVGDICWVDVTAGGSALKNTVTAVTAATFSINNTLPDSLHTKFRVERTLTSPVQVTPSAVTATTVTLPATMTTPVGGVARTVVYAEAFIGYKALRTDLADVSVMSDEAGILADLGKFDARNPLCVGATIAKKNTSSTVQVYGIATNDSAGYAAMRAQTSSRNDIYAVVPLTQDIDIITDFKTEFEGIADAVYVVTNGVAQKFRVVIGQPGSLPADGIITDRNTDGTVAVGAATPTDNVVVTLANFSPGSLATLGVLPGYKVIIDAVTYTVASVTGTLSFTVDGAPPPATPTISVEFTTPAGVTVGGADATTDVTVAAAAPTYTVLGDLNGTFVDDGVKAGDFVEIPADPSTTSFAGTLIRLQVASVVSNQTLNVVGSATVRDTSLVANELPHGYSRVLVGGVLAVVDAAHVYRVVRPLDADGQVDDLIDNGPGSLLHRRAWVCWPDLVDVSDLKDGSLPRLTLATATPTAAESQPGYYLACMVGGLVAALPSHHGLTRLGGSGIRKLYNSNTYFSDKQLTKLSNNGWMVFQQDTATSLPYIIHGLTSDVSALEFGEAMMVKNLDYVSMVYSDSLSGFLGTWNINEETMGFIGSALTVVGDTLRLDRRPKIGARIRSARIVQLEESSLAPDRLEVKVEVDFPKPLNTIGLHLVSI